MNPRLSSSLICTLALAACGPPKHMDSDKDQVPNANRGIVELFDAPSPPDIPIDNPVLAFIGAGSAMGCTVGITKEGEVAYLQAYGEADVGQDMTIYTRSAVGSISKVLTSMAALKLVDMGELEMGTRFTEVVDHGPLPETYRDATLEDLLSHRSGAKYWPDWKLGDEASTRAWLNFAYGPEDESGALPRKAILGLAEEMPTASEGVYSNLGYLMVAAMVDAVAADPGFEGYPDGQAVERGYESFVWTLLNESGIKMFSSALNHPWREDGDLEVFAADPSWGDWGYFGWEAGAGGWTMTIGDLARLSLLLRGEEILTGETWDDMKTSRGDLNLDGASPMGLGLILHDRANGREAIGHDGGVHGYRSTVYYLPAEDLGVAVMCNNGSGNVSELADAIGAAWLGGGGVFGGGLDGDAEKAPERGAVAFEHLVDDPRGPSGSPPVFDLPRPVPTVTVHRIARAVERLRTSGLTDLVQQVEGAVERYGLKRALRRLKRAALETDEGKPLIRAAKRGQVARFARCYLSMLGDTSGNWRCR